MRVLLVAGLVGVLGCEVDTSAVDAGGAQIDAALTADMTVGAPDMAADQDMTVLDMAIALDSAVLRADMAFTELDGAAAGDAAPEADAQWADAESRQPDAEPQSDAAHAPDAAPAVLCPPSAPFGNGIGDTAPNMTLSRCDGANFDFHAQCGQPIWVFQFAGWCPPCRTFASNIEPLAERARELGYQPVFVISEDSDLNPANGADCDQVTRQYGLTMPVLYDSAGAFSGRLNVAKNSVNVVIGADGTVLFKSQWDSVADMGPVLERLAE